MPKDTFDFEQYWNYKPFKKFFLFHLFIFVYVLQVSEAYVFNDIYIEARRQLLGVCSLLHHMYLGDTALIVRLGGTHLLSAEPPCQSDCRKV